MHLSLSSVSLFPATPEQITAIRRESFKVWNRDLTLAEYVQRYYIDLQREYGSGGRLIGWVLAPRDNPTTLDFLSSCRTFRRDALVLRGGRGDGPESMTCYTVASVFTPPNQRGRGYARHMMRLLHWLLSPMPSSSIVRSPLTSSFPDEWGAPPMRLAQVGDASCSVLYSDLGPDFYRTCGPTENAEGWIAKESFATQWNVLQWIQKQEEMTGSNFPTTSIPASGLKWLDEDGNKVVWEEDSAQTSIDMATQGAKIGRDEVLFTILPNKGVAEYQVRMSQRLWEKMIPAVNFWGLRLKEGSDGVSVNGPTFATWTVEVHSPGPRTLLITRLRVSSIPIFAGMFREIMKYAASLRMDFVEVWNIPDVLKEMASQTGGRTFELEEHLPSVMWYGKDKPETVKWMFNERFCWS